MLPGFVNVHTHLELTGLRDHAPEDDFVAWIQRIRVLKEETDRAAYVAAARVGLREAWRHGTTTVADTGTSGATVAALRELGGRGIYYQEAIAPDAAVADRALARYAEELGALRAQATAAVRIGASPHAPYTVSAPLLRGVADLARRERLPLAMHVAESRAETAFVTAQAGAFAELWRARGLALPERARSAVAYVERAGLLGPDCLAIHVVQVDADDVARLAATDTGVAACPRSNRRHGHGDPPLAALRTAGVRVGLGTDSVASVGSLDLLAEARAAAEIAGISADEAVALLTIGGARALGMEREIGSLEPGKWADLCVVAAGAGAGRDGADAVLRAGPDAIVATYVAGVRVFERRAAV